ncbi:MAG TPA: FHA domain-containing protein [Solirubrobacteraceae bacterium]|nr:FHA domain-containing protein [Solirubrobacteraceae bacterium]
MLAIERLDHPRFAAGTTASHLHAILERFPAAWCVTDLGSSNGTWVNGERIWSSRRLRHGDEIRIGQTRLIFRDAPNADGAQTEAEIGPPTLTVRERDVLVALCRPLLDRDMFTEPSSTKAIAEALVITQAAVKQHLANLYDKFGVASTHSNRRARLANEALHRGAVSLTELRPRESSRSVS